MYGANGHYDYTQSIAQQIAGLQTVLGGTDKTGLYRVTDEGNATSLTYLQSLAAALQKTSIKMICCVDINFVDSNNVLLPSEAAAYQIGFQRGVRIASALVPLGVTLFECGNELDSKNDIRVYPGCQGGIPEDFHNAMFPAVRGVVNGCMDGIRSIGGSSVQCGSPALTACSIAFLDMLLDGTQPDGSKGYTKMRPDWIAVHSYKAWNDPFNISMDYQKPTINLFDHIKCKTNGLPIYITECNGDENSNDVDRTTWVSQLLQKVYSYRTIFNIQGICIYQLINGSPWGLLNADMSTVQTFGATVMNFIAAHPA